MALMFDGHEWDCYTPPWPLTMNVAHSSSGLGHRPLKAEIRGSNPLCATHGPVHPAKSKVVLENPRYGAGFFDA